MRTNITIDESLVSALQGITGAGTKAKAVLVAIREYMRWYKISQISRYRGKVKFHRELEKARINDR